MSRDNKESRSAEFNRWRHVSPKPGQAKFRAVGADSIALLTERIRGRVKLSLLSLLVSCQDSLTLPKILNFPMVDLREDRGSKGDLFHSISISNKGKMINELIITAR